MNHVIHNSIVNFIWGIADDVLRDVYVRGKYRDVILPMTVIRRHGKDVSIHLFGQEVQPETYAISKADLLLKGEGAEAENMKYGSTLSSDAFPSQEFDFMLSNPPYGKSWKTDLERLGGKGDIKDPRFVTQHGDDPEFKMITRSSDGQLMFLVNKLSKMKHTTRLGSRIAEVHNGSSLFTGDAGQGESNIRNEAFGYWKVTVYRPLRLAVDLSPARLGRFERACAKANVGANGHSPLPNLARRVAETIGAGPHLDFNVFMDDVEADADKHGVKLTAKRKKLLQSDLCDTSEDAAPVLKKVHKPGKTTPDPIHGLFEAEVGGKHCVVEYEPDTALRDSEQVPLLEEGGIEAFFRREVLPYTPDAWIDPDKTLVGYEISFTRHFYRPASMRTLEEIKADIYALEQETEGLLEQIVGEAE